MDADRIDVALQPLFSEILPLEGQSTADLIPHGGGRAEAAGLDRHGRARLQQDEAPCIDLVLAESVSHAGPASASRGPGRRPVIDPRDQKSRLTPAVTVWVVNAV